MMNPESPFTFEELLEKLPLPLAQLYNHAMKLPYPRDEEYPVLLKPLQVSGEVIRAAFQEKGIELQWQEQICSVTIQIEGAAAEKRYPRIIFSLGMEPLASEVERPQKFIDYKQKGEGDQELFPGAVVQHKDRRIRLGLTVEDGLAVWRLPLNYAALPSLELARDELADHEDLRLSIAQAMAESAALDRGRTLT